MYSKIILLLTLYITNVCCNDLRIGFTKPSSKKIYSEIKEMDPALWKRTDDIIINAPNNEIIDAVYVTDLREDKDGEAFIESGGVGMKSVTIGLKSPSILRGYKFEIEVYGDNPNAGYFSKGYNINPYYDTQYARKY